MAEQQVQQDLNELLQIRRDKLALMQKNGNNPFDITTYEVNSKAKEIVDNFVEAGEGEAGRQVSAAGRIMSWRDMGKAAFMDLRDVSGRIQLYVKNRRYRGRAIQKSCFNSGYRRHCGRKGRGFQNPTG